MPKNSSNGTVRTMRCSLRLLAWYHPRRQNMHIGIEMIKAQDGFLALMATILSMYVRLVRFRYRLPTAFDLPSMSSHIQRHLSSTWKKLDPPIPTRRCSLLSPRR